MIRYGCTNFRHTFVHKEKGRAICPAFCLVRWNGLEPSQGCPRQPLKLVRLPIPPPPHFYFQTTNVLLSKRNYYIHHPLSGVNTKFTCLPEQPVSLLEVLLVLRELLELVRQREPVPVREPALPELTWKT